MRRTTSPRRSPSPRRTLARAAEIAAHAATAAPVALAAATDAADGAADALARCPSDDLRAPVVALRDLSRDTAAQAAHWTTLAARFDAGMHDLLHAAQKAKAVRGTSVHAARLQAVGASRDVGAALSVAATRYAALADAIDTANATTQITLADVLAGRATRGAQ